MIKKGRRSPPGARSGVFLSVLWFRFAPPGRSASAHRPLAPRCGFRLLALTARSKLLRVNSHRVRRGFCMPHRSLCGFALADFCTRDGPTRHDQTADSSQKRPAILQLHRHSKAHGMAAPRATRRDSVRAATATARACWLRPTRWRMKSITISSILGPPKCGLSKPAFRQTNQYFSQTRPTFMTHI